MYHPQLTEVIVPKTGGYPPLVYGYADWPRGKPPCTERDQHYKNSVRIRTRRPTAVLIAGYNSPLLQQQNKFTTMGFNVKASYSLLDGYTQVLQFLALPKPIRSTIVLIDIHSIQPGFPELSGSLIAAVLAQHMRLGEIHAAWLIGFSENQDSEREVEALVAGCHHVLPTPIADDAFLMLQDITLQTPTIPHLDAWPDQIRIIRVLQNMATRVLQSVRDAYIESWSPDDLAEVLGWITRYPVKRTVSGTGTAKVTFQSLHSERLVRALGGPRAAHARLKTIADQWQERYPLHSQILQQFLDGRERREIVRYFVAQRLYEDTRIYSCIKELAVQTTHSPAPMRPVRSIFSSCHSRGHS